MSNGVWIVYYHDLHRIPIAIFPEDQELEARRFAADHYMSASSEVGFWPFGQEWEAPEGLLAEQPATNTR